MEAENLYMSRERSAAHTQRPSFLPRGGSPKGEAIGLTPDTLHRPRGIIRGRYGHPRARELLPRGPDFLSIVATNTPFLASIFTMTQSRWMLKRPHTHHVLCCSLCVRHPPLPHSSATDSSPAPASGPALSAFYLICSSTVFSSPRYSTISSITRPSFEIAHGYVFWYVFLPSHLPLCPTTALEL